jgi:hypothetical protein
MSSEPATLHAFGWGLVLEPRQRVRTGYEPRTSPVASSTFPADRDELGRGRVRAWLARVGDALTTEAELTSDEAAQEERIREAVLGSVVRAR